MKWSESQRPRAGGPWGGALRAAAWAWLGVAVALPAAAQIPGAGAGPKDLTLVGALAV